MGWQLTFPKDLFTDILKEKMNSWVGRVQTALTGIQTQFYEFLVRKTWWILCDNWLLYWLYKILLQTVSLEVVSKQLFHGYIYIKYKVKYLHTQNDT